MLIVLAQIKPAVRDALHLIRCQKPVTVVVMSPAILICVVRMCDFSKLRNFRFSSVWRNNLFQLNFLWCQMKNNRFLHCGIVVSVTICYKFFGLQWNCTFLNSQIVLCLQICFIAQNIKVQIHGGFPFSFLCELQADLAEFSWITCPFE